MTDCAPEFTESGECPIGDLVIRINRLAQPAEVWRIEGELVNYEVDPDRTIKLILVPTYNIPNLDDVTRRGMICHPAKQLVVLPTLRKLTRELADCRTTQSNHDMKVNIIMTELEEELARQKRLVEEFQNGKNIAESANDEQKVELAPPINANLLVKVQKQYNECKKSLADKSKQLEDCKKQEEKWVLELRQGDERRKQDAELAQKERARITKEAEERLARELKHKDEDYDERLRIEKEKMEAVEKQLQRRLKNLELEHLAEAKVLKAQQISVDEENAKLKRAVTVLGRQKEDWEKQKRALEVSAEERGAKEKRSRPDYPPPHVLRKPPPPPRPAPAPRPAPPPPKNILRVVNVANLTPVTISASSSSTSSPGTARSSSSGQKSDRLSRLQPQGKNQMPPPSAGNRGASSAKSKSGSFRSKTGGPSGKGASPGVRGKGASPGVRGKGSRRSNAIKPQKFSEPLMGSIQDRIEHAIGRKDA